MLFLSGGGSGARSEEIDRLFVGMLDKSKPVLYIPIAIDVKRHPYPECLVWIKNNFKPHGFENFVMCTELSRCRSKDPSAFGGIYIGGGNTPHLLNEIKKTGFWDFIILAHKKGVPIAGGSAGAIIFGKSILTSLHDDANEVGLTDFSAFNLVAGYDIWAHYKPTQAELLRREMKLHNLDRVIALPNECALFVKGRKATIVGKAPATLFTAHEEKDIAPNDVLDF